MNQTTAFSPHLVCKLLDGRLARFARSDADHWATICEEIKAPKVVRLRAELDAATDVKPLLRLQLIEDIEDMEVTSDEALRLCVHTPKWMKRHLTVAYTEAGGVEADAAGVLKLIPFTMQQSIAHQIAMMPVVKGAEVGTEENPLIVGEDFVARRAEAERLAAEEKARATTGEKSSPPSGDATPASIPESSPIEPSSN